jgi:formate-dependent nitrite reductase cytochrome c552 subunit
MQRRSDGLRQARSRSGIALAVARLLSALRRGAVAALSVLALAVPLLIQAQDEPSTADTQAAASDSRDLAERVNGHRPLRSNPPDDEAPQQPPPSFEGYADVPEFGVVPRSEHLNFYPCEDCHAVMPVNTTRRQLYSPHPGTLDHGAGRIWCLDCHAGENRNALKTLAGEEVGFDEAYQVCGQCHYQPQKDWFYGAHGKRVGNWQGERELYNCTHCHNPHDPAVRPRAPESPPPVRRGLTLPVLHGEHPNDAGEEHK